MTDYIHFCQDICLPTKTVTQYRNSKPWFNKSIRSKIVAKDAAYRCRDTDSESYRNARSALKKAIRQEKRTFRDRVEEKFESGDSTALRSNMNLITNYKAPSKSADPDDVTLLDRLNEFYARFDRNNKSTASPAPCDDDQPPFVITDHDVRRNFSKLEEHKAPGPDGITTRLLKLCCSR